MGKKLGYLCQAGTRRLIWLIGVSFAVILLIQNFELLYGTVIWSLFSEKVSVVGNGSFPTWDLSSKAETVGNKAHLNSLNSTDTYAIHELANKTETSGGMVIQPNNAFTSDRHEGSNESFRLDDDSNTGDEFQSGNFVELDKNSAVTNGTRSDNGSAPKGAEANEVSLFPNNDTMDGNSSLDNVEKENITLASENIDSSDANLASPLLSLPPMNISVNVTAPENVDTDSKTAETSFNSNTSMVNKDATPSFDENERPEQFTSDLTSWVDSPSIPSVPEVKQMPEVPTSAVNSISDMNNFLLQNRMSPRSMIPRWSSAVDQELLNAKSQIENAPIAENDPKLYAPLYRNVSMFRRSYELMEDTLKVYFYREGKKPIFHQPVLKGIYASEGWFMRLLEANKKFVSKSPQKAHLFYLPFSSRLLEETLYVPNSHNRKNLIEHLKNYLDMIVAKYPFWNRTGGADHFLVACHDWAPSETRELMAKCIRALCNSDIKEGFIFGKDVSLPETTVRTPQNPLRDLGGKPPSKRSILAFFAGNMHGYLRPILLQHWGNKDPEIKIFGRMPKAKGKMSYAQHMKSSKYCICAKGYEVNSPRVVEAIFYECVPVIISDNFVPPFFEVLNWESFAVFILEKDIPNLKNILLSIPEKRYREMQTRVKRVQQHFLWHAKPVKYDIFHMILHSIWYNRVFQINTR